MLKLKDTLDLEITDIAFGGKGVGQVEGFKILVDHAVPTQKVHIEITQRKKRYALARIVKILRDAENVFENDFQPTPGAPWKDVPIKLQQAYKTQQVFSLFERIGKIDIQPMFDGYLEAPEAWHYRNKMEYSFGPTEEAMNANGAWVYGGFALGFKHSGQYWLVEPLEKISGLFDEAFEKALPAFQQLCQTLHPAPYNARKRSGFWRQLGVRKSFTEDCFILYLLVNHDTLTAEQKAEIVVFWRNILGDRLRGIELIASDRFNSPLQKYIAKEILYGKMMISEHFYTESADLPSLSFRISRDSFFQTNVKSAELLYQKVVEYASKNDFVLELFSGTGTISQILSKNKPHRQILALELNKNAINDAKENAKINGIKNISWVCEDVNDFIKSEPYIPENANVILDPPRAGIAAKTLKMIVGLKPQEMIYVSCNPSTLARDAHFLALEGYEMQKIALIDQFPHTHHIECVTVFTRVDQ